MKKEYNFKVENLYSHGFFGGRVFDGRHHSNDVEFSCDICGASEKSTKHELFGPYRNHVGWTEKHSENFLCDISFGYNDLTLVVCNTHTEKEIKQKIKELKENE